VAGGAAFPPMANVVILVIVFAIVAGLVTYGIRSHLTRRNMRNRNSYEETLGRRARIVERRRAIPQNLGRRSRIEGPLTNPRHNGPHNSRAGR